MRHHATTYQSAAALLAAGMLAASPAAMAAGQTQNGKADSTMKQTMQKVTPENSSDSSTSADMNTSDEVAVQSSTGDHSEAVELVRQAADVVGQMKQDPEVKNLLEKAKGVYLVPEFGRGAFIVGARGGAGVMSAQQPEGWTDPAFYDFGGISVGPQAGGSGGSIAFLLMSDDAVDAFKGGNQVSLNADAGLSVINYSANAQASWGKADVILWSDTEGAYIGADISVSNINWDDDSNQAFYNKKVELSQLLSGNVGENTEAEHLKQALPSS